MRRGPRTGGYRASTGRRHNLKVAIDVVMGIRKEQTREALSVPRGHFHSANRTLEVWAVDPCSPLLPLRLNRR